MVSGAPPIRAKKLRYFEDRNFADRVLPPPPVIRSIGREQADDWWGATAPCVPQADEDDEDTSVADGSLELQPELTSPEPSVPEYPEDGRASDLDEANAPEEARHLNAVRRAAGLDRPDNDFLPDF
jgi:type IV secretion system protein VirD4